jgi:dihydrofolate reductase
MRKLMVFNQVSLDGYIADEHGDMSWAHKHDPEWLEFVSGNASGESMLLFGRRTYDLMASYWPTPLAHQNAPVVAAHMNRQPKVVFSRTMKQASWENTTVLQGDIAAEVRKLKAEPGPDMVLMGSGTIVSQLTNARVIDEYQLVLNAIVLGRGRKLFDEVQEKLPLTLKKTRVFGNGNIVLWYAPAV